VLLKAAFIRGCNASLEVITQGENFDNMSEFRNESFAVKRKAENP
jgi:hypothetical protein